LAYGEKMPVEMARIAKKTPECAKAFKDLIQLQSRVESQIAVGGNGPSGMDLVEEILARLQQVSGHSFNEFILYFFRVIIDWVSSTY
jgi:NADH dehydrogenase FAD-containing subunit